MMSGSQFLMVTAAHFSSPAKNSNEASFQQTDREDLRLTYVKSTIVRIVKMSADLILITVNLSLSQRMCGTLDFSWKVKLAVSQGFRGLIMKTQG